LWTYLWSLISYPAHSRWSIIISQMTSRLQGDLTLTPPLFLVVTHCPHESKSPASQTCLSAISYSAPPLGFPGSSAGKESTCNAGDPGLIPGSGRSPGEGDDRGWDGWMASPTWWPWVWASSGSWWWTGKPGVLQSMGSQRVRHDWTTELNWLNWSIVYNLGFTLISLAFF